MANGLRVAVVDYDAGNTLSVTRALEKVGAVVDLTPEPSKVASADAVVLPGVGNFGDCLEKLRSRGLDAACREAVERGTPFLGVCVGLQALFEGSEESPEVSGLGILSGTCRRFVSDESGERLRIPHMGWNHLSITREHPVLDGLDGEAFYFVHSYYPEPLDEGDLLATADYGGEFCAAAGRDNLVATQFHPEKSSRAGLTLYANFLAWAEKTG
ncbi:imidazole glycerol phosphate synthase subunit HisH [Rubrobacter aplysinae]|uniref:imidazole glycerol phosphate synthase subunit HisH n=1 Tax=Rubrobacter aplysinae TaxID=909625 RepID=UPI00064B9F93|nr:imidazole glycerol phosphate synthase subunit HisH [Rubrobacter aplysinae]